MKEKITISLRHPTVRVDIHPILSPRVSRGTVPPATFKSYEVPTEAAQALMKLGATRALQRILNECRSWGR